MTEPWELMKQLIYEMNRHPLQHVMYCELNGVITNGLERALANRMKLTWLFPKIVLVHYGDKAPLVCPPELPHLCCHLFLPPEYEKTKDIRQEVQMHCNGTMALHSCMLVQSQHQKCISITMMALDNQSHLAWRCS